MTLISVIRKALWMISVPSATGNGGRLEMRGGALLEHRALGSLIFPVENKKERKRAVSQYTRRSQIVTIHRMGASLRG
jgi:hypothetical protein